MIGWILFVGFMCLAVGATLGRINAISEMTRYLNKKGYNSFEELEDKEV